MELEDVEQQRPEGGPLPPNVGLPSLPEYPEEEADQVDQGGGAPLLQCMQGDEQQQQERPSLLLASEGIDEPGALGTMGTDQDRRFSLTGESLR